MCGIFGFIAPAGTPWDADLMRHFISDLIGRSEPRGRDAAGLVIISDGQACVFKKAMRPDRLLKRRDFRDFMAENLGAATMPASGGGAKLSRPLAVIGHCRLVTNGAEIVPGNNQPIITGKTVGIHNGIVTNDAELWAMHDDLVRQLDTDSEIIFQLVDARVATGMGMAEVLSETYQELVGTASTVLYSDGQDALALASNNGSLFYAHVADPGVLFFASERYILDAFMAANQAAIGGGGSTVQLKAGDAALVPLSDAVPLPFKLEKQTDRPKVLARQHNLESPLFRICDLSERISDLQRCTQCILPATYPFIDFDSDGVCNYCRQYTPPKLAGPEALEAELAKHRRTDGETDCIVAFSGGRDSSYGLHVLTQDYGMTPMAYSYDWGMVTSIARRNQARMCGKLKVEHIFRAADIPAKRRYIRKNIYAWLRHPHLGMVPLFMAGDKFFYQIGRALRGETKIPLVIFCAGNPLERTDFKGGFAGVRESQHGQRLFAFSVANKMQIAAFYLAQYLRNPAYINESLFDSVASYFTTFVGKDDFLYLFHYLEWNEDEINRTLIGTYDWETVSHTENTWRIGDGYTSFINYIYRTVAGFSEFDTYRSQQIRAGLITREQAMLLIEHDNAPHLPTLYEFASQVGINLEEVMTRIDAIPKLY